MIFIGNTKYHLKKGGEIKQDKNTKDSMIFSVLAGECPYKVQFLAGTVAENLGVKVGKTYAINVTETGEENEHGKQYRLDVLDTISIIELPKTVIAYGKPKIIDQKILSKEDAKNVEANATMETVHTV